MVDQKNIGQFIAYLRKKKNLTQAELGALLGVSDKAISKWENGNSAPDLVMMNSICEVLEISMIELINCKENTEESISQTQLLPVAEEKKEGLVDYIKNNNKIKIILSSIGAVMIVFIITFAFLFHYFIKNYNTVNIYSISSGNDKYYVDGMLTLTPNKMYLIINDIKNIGDYELDGKKTLTYDISIFNGDLEIYRRGDINLFEKNKTYTALELNNIIENLNICLQDSNLSESLLNDIRKSHDFNMSIRIRYILTDNSQEEITIILNSNNTFSN